MEESSLKEPIFKRWWFWLVILILLVIFVVCLRGFLKDKRAAKEQNNNKIIEHQKKTEEKPQEKKKNEGDFVAVGETKTFSAEQLAAANTALNNGIKIDDPQNDWYKVAEGTKQSDGRPDNPNPYPLGWTDLKSLNIGADQNYIYIKFIFWDRFPDKALSYSGDKMDGGSAKINYFTFTNSQGKQDWADLITPISLREQSNGKLMPSEVMAMISPKGKDVHNETLFTTYTKDGLFAGGPGKDYLLSAFPLEQFNLKLGDKVTFDCTTEIGSEIYHHEAIDILLSRDDSKFADTIEYVLGSNTYQNMAQQNEDTHS